MCRFEMEREREIVAANKPMGPPAVRILMPNKSQIDDDDSRCITL